jgi:hypothetical protein
MSGVSSDRQLRNTMQAGTRWPCRVLRRSCGILGPLRGIISSIRMKVFAVVQVAPGLRNRPARSRRLHAASPGTSRVLIRACCEQNAVPPFKFSLRFRTLTSRSSHGLAQHSVAVAGQFLQIGHGATCTQCTDYVAIGHAYAVRSTVELMAVSRLLLETRRVTARRI